MTNLRKNHKGFAIVEIALLIVVLVVIGLVAFKVRSSSNTPASSNTQASATETALPSKISTKTDVNKTIDAVDSTPINDKLNPSQLDTGLNSIL